MPLYALEMPAANELESSESLDADRPVNLAPFASRDCFSFIAGRQSDRVDETHITASGDCCDAASPLTQVLLTESRDVLM